MHVIDTTCFDECFLFHMRTRSHCFLYKSLLWNWSFLHRHVIAFFGTGFLREVRIFRYLYNNSTKSVAGDWQCCQCTTPKWLTLISIVEFSFLKMLWTRLSNLTKSSSGWHCSEALKSFGGYNFSCYPVFNTIRDSVQCTKCASLFFYN